MKIPEEAIAKAIEGGWIPKGVEAHKITGWTLDDGVLKILGTYNKTKSVTDYILVEQIALDPSFWQSLGKALGWGIRKTMFHTEIQDDEWYRNIENKKHAVYQGTEFANLILTGGDTDAYWKGLLDKTSV
jgi:hypothetical protein